MTALEFEVLELARDIEVEQSLSTLLTHDDEDTYAEDGALVWAARIARGGES